jgi:GNAT superfamily N-acetyltransferase
MKEQFTAFQSAGGRKQNLRLVYAHDLGRNVQYLAFGRNRNLERQLVDKSLQPHILESTPKDASSRFKDADHLEAWFQKGREVHWLLGPSADLAGIIWYGREPLPSSSTLYKPPQHTFAIRLYEGYTGQGLARPFMEKSLRHYAGDMALRNEAFRGIWLQTDIANEAALRTYQHVGYQEIGRDTLRVTMVLSPEQIRRVCDPGA